MGWNGGRSSRGTHSQGSVETFAGRRTWWHFTVEKLHSTCQPEETGKDILLFSQQCNNMLSFFLSHLNHVPRNLRFIKSISGGVKLRLTLTLWQKCMEKYGLFAKEIYISLIFFLFFLFCSRNKVHYPFLRH